MSPESLNKIRKMAKEAGPTVQREVNKGLREAGKIGAEAAKAAVTSSSPPKADQRGDVARLLRAKERFGNGRGHSGLREGIAKGIRVALGGKQGIRIVSTDRGLPEGQKAMNRVYRLRTFRHPVFGNKKAWAQQHGSDYFYGPIEKTQPQMVENVSAALESAADKIANL